MSTARADAPLLAVRGAVKEFPGVRALDGVDFTLRAGEVHALLGENGAGKSTLISVITGAQHPEAGEVRLEGRALKLHGVADAEAAGVAAVYQEVNLLPNLSVAENILLGRQPTRFGIVQVKEMNARAAAALSEFGVTLDVSQPLGACSTAIQQLVAIARARAINARVLVLDEPTASLDAEEVAALFAVLRRLKAEGVGIVFVTHFLDQVFAIADRITVLRNGKMVGERNVADVTQMDVVSLMLGRELGAGPARHKQSAERTGAPLARFKGYGARRKVEPFDIELHSGEVVGVGGLLGSGRTETALLMFGALRADHGSAEVDGKPAHITSPRAAIRLGFAFCPEDRKRDAIAASLSVRENIILALQAREGALRPIPRKRQQEIAERLIKALDIRTTDAEKPIGQLSGGNQQKAVLARWLAANPKLMLLDEPTRGIDIGAHAEILAEIGKMCAAGMGVYLISSEIDELVAAADRVSVMRERRQVGMLEGDAVNAAAIMSAIVAP